MSLGSSGDGAADRRLLIALGLLVAVLYVPFAGNYGLWDPWETHYWRARC